MERLNKLHLNRLNTLDLVERMQWQNLSISKAGILRSWPWSFRDHRSPFCSDTSMFTPQVQVSDWISRGSAPTCVQGGRGIRLFLWMLGPKLLFQLLGPSQCLHSLDFFLLLSLQVCSMIGFLLHPGLLTDSLQPRLLTFT